MGITFYPRMFMSPDPAPIPTAARPGAEPPEPLFLNYTRAHGVLGIGYHKGHYMSRATKEFIRIAKERIPYNPD